MIQTERIESAGQVEGDAAAGGPLDPDAAAVGLDEAAGDGQAEAGAAAWRGCGWGRRG